MEPTFGSDNLTVEELFEKYYGEPISYDPLPGEVRSRILFLTKSMSAVLFEKSHAHVHGRRNESALWNNLQTMVYTELRALESVNISLCSEAKMMQ